MLSPKCILPCAVFLVLAGRLSTSVHAGDWSTGKAEVDQQGTNQPTALVVKLKSEEMSGMRPVQRAYVDFGTNRFAFIVPPGFRMDTSNPDRVDLVNADYSCFLSFRLMGPALSDGKALSTGLCRELLLRQFPDAIIVGELSQSVANHDGPAFDFKWKNPHGVAQSSRVAFIPSTTGTLQFSLLTPSEKFSEGLYFYNGLVLSFCSNERGKLQITPLSERF